MKTDFGKRNEKIDLKQNWLKIEYHFFFTWSKLILNKVGQKWFFARKLTKADVEQKFGYKMNKNELWL